MYKDKRVDLKDPEDLTDPFKCPDCQKTLSAPEYKCEHCKHFLVFYV